MNAPHVDDLRVPVDLDTDEVVLIEQAAVPADVLGIVLRIDSENDALLLELAEEALAVEVVGDRPLADLAGPEGVVQVADNQFATSQAGVGGEDVAVLAGQDAAQEGWVLEVRVVEQVTQIVFGVRVQQGNLIEEEQMLERRRVPLREGVGQPTIDHPPGRVEDPARQDVLEPLGERAVMPSDVHRVVDQDRTVELGGEQVERRLHVSHRVIDHAADAAGTIEAPPHPHQGGKRQREFIGEGAVEDQVEPAARQVPQFVPQDRAVLRDGKRRPQRDPVFEAGGRQERLDVEVQAIPDQKDLEGRRGRAQHDCAGCSAIRDPGDPPPPVRSRQPDPRVRRARRTPAVAPRRLRCSGPSSP